MFQYIVILNPRLLDHMGGHCRLRVRETAGGHGDFDKKFAAGPSVALCAQLATQ